MCIRDISKVIPEKNIVFFAPHFDDFLLNIGGYVDELGKKNLLDSKSFHIIVLFSVNNYMAGTGQDNYDTSLARIKLATGSAIIEDMSCCNELIGEHNYRYELAWEKDCLMRGKSLADSELEFPKGTYKDFNEEDWMVYKRIQASVRQWALNEDTALIFPLAIKEHMDHFITREAALSVAKELGSNAKAKFYFQEDKPYGGMADQAELESLDEFINANPFEEIVYHYDAERIVELAFKHYVSQVEEVYGMAIRNRSEYLKKLYKSERPCDRIFLYKV